MVVVVRNARDGSGVANAFIALTHDETGLEWTEDSDAHGIAAVPATPGRHVLRVLCGEAELQKMVVYPQDSCVAVSVDLARAAPGLRSCAIDVSGSPL